VKLDVQLGRVLRTLPEVDRAEKRSGATFVNILFGLVVTDGAVKLARQGVVWWADGWDAVEVTRVTHLAVALALTILSWIGYHQSQQYPPFLIKFLNIPFVMFILDVLMVVAYYGVTLLAENGSPIEGPVLEHSALPEALLIFVVFVLYAMWDYLNYRLFKDPAYASSMETPRPPDTNLGPRRHVTFRALLTAGALLATVWLLDPSSPAWVAVIDLILVSFLVLYRVAKQAVDPKVKIRPV
jgi:hypothetical protein